VRTAAAVEVDGAHVERRAADGARAAADAPRGGRSLSEVPAPEEADARIGRRRRERHRELDVAVTGRRTDDRVPAHRGAGHVVCKESPGAGEGLAEVAVRGEEARRV